MGSAFSIGMNSVAAARPSICEWPKGAVRKGSRRTFRSSTSRNVRRLFKPGGLHVRQGNICPAGKLLHTTGRIQDGTTLLYRARVANCGLLSAKSHVVSMRMPAMSPGPLSALLRLSSRAAIASGSRCCSPITSAFCDLADVDCAARAVHKMSSHSPPSRRTFAALQNSFARPPPTTRACLA
jgi:hypothetical protein